MAAHVQIGQSRKSVRRVWVEGERRFVLRFCVGKSILLFEQRRGSKMRLHIFRLELGSLMISIKGFVGIAGLEQLCQ